MEKKHIDDIASVIMGQSPKSEFYNNDGNGVPFLQGNRTFGRKYPTFDTFTTAPTKMAKANDIIMSVRAPVGDLNITPVDMCLGRGVCALRMKNGNQQYLFYLLKHNIRHLINKESGTVFGSVNRNDIGGLEVEVHDEKNQKRIARFLTQIDDKIENNDAINNNLQQQAEALFAENFLNITDIPLGWRKGNLLDIADYLNGLAMQKFRPKEGELGLPVLKIKELRQGFCDTDSELCSPSIRSDYLVHDGDVVFSWSGSLLVDFWCGGDCGLNQHLFKVTSRRYEPWFYYLWTNYHLAKFVAIAADKATTMGHIKREDLAKAKVLIPSTEDYNKIGEVLRPLLSMAIYNRIENKKLSTLRDAILPKLMSGEIDVSEVEI